MFSVRLSSVMTGCGGKDTTRSRRSTRARMRSMNGTNSELPADRAAVPPQPLDHGGFGLRYQGHRFGHDHDGERDQYEEEHQNCQTHGTSFRYAFLKTTAVAPSMCTTVTD
ncbi:hypothetical protein Mkiyose1088_54060 [Mycobacterium kiyosense]|nr:hypothetical protein Mkiyose1088_54060 [Mycobacterium kiyosense]GLD06362.1 hypothetical protein Mkiyose1383_26880 [Mycobacterium kiyosense]GLD25208.1 hypothetical protein Mkiyose1386_32010 [Mycobacterium kiyosense]